MRRLLKAGILSFYYNHGGRDKVMRIAIIKDDNEFAGELKGLIYNYAKANNIPADVGVYACDEDFLAAREEEADRYINSILEKHSKEAGIVGNENTSLIIKKRNAVQRVPYRNILYFSKEKHYTYVHTAKEEYKFIIGFKELREAIPEIYKHCFVQCYRSFIVNMSYVQSVHKDYIKLLGGEEIPVGGTYVRDVREAFEEYFKE